MKKVIIFTGVFILVIIAISASLIFIIEGDTNKNKDIADSENKIIKDSDNLKKDESSDSNLPSVKTDANNIGGGVSGGAGGAGGSSGDSGDDSEEKNETDIPEEVYTSPCGFYFSNYGVCAGTCPAGKCSQEGMSCYCRL